MRVSPVSLNKSSNKIDMSSIRKNSTSGVRNSSVNFTGSTPQSLKDVFMAKSVYDSWLSKVNPANKTLGEKIVSYDFGVELANAVYRKFVNTKMDYSDYIVQLRDKILEQNYEFTLSHNWLVSNKKLNANNYMIEHFDKIIPSIKLLGIETLIWALGMKQQRFENLLTDVERYYSFSPISYQELLMEMTNPKMTHLYAYLEGEKSNIQAKMHGEDNQEFLDLHSENKRRLEVLNHMVKQKKLEKDTASVKQLYQMITELRRKEFESKTADFKELEKEMTKIKADINKLMQNSIKDPQKKIELFYVYKGHVNIDDLQKLNSLIKDKSEQGVLNYQEFLTNILADLYKLSPEQRSVFEGLEFYKTPYYTKLFQAVPREQTYAYGVRVQAPQLQNGFYQQFLNLMNIVANETDFNSECENLLTVISKGDYLQKVFDKLPQNIETKNILKQNNLKYDVWSTFDAKRDFIQIDDRTVIKKVDMNDIKHSLFLGNQACCCTAVGSGSRSGSAPSYPMNKFIQAIELLVDGVVAGNTMCYLATIDAKSYPRVTQDGLGEIVVCDNEKTNKLALILDNMEVLKPYCYEEKYLDAFIKYAEKLIQDIGGKSDMAIYAGHRNKFAMMDNFKKENLMRMTILGTSGKQTLSIDSIANMPVNNGSVSFDKYYYGNFYCIKP